MKLDRFQICVIIVGCCLLAYHAVPLVEANPALGPIVKPIIKAFVKLLKSVEIDAAHKSAEKAIQKIKDNPEKYGFTAVDVTGVTADCIATFTKTEDSTTYEVKLKANDDEQRFETYVNGERINSLDYKDIKNLSEDEAATKISNLEEDVIIRYHFITHKINISKIEEYAISMYKMRHPVGN